MKSRTMYNSKEEFERLNPYVCVETPSHQGSKCGLAQVVESYSSKKVAEEKSNGGRIMTRKRSVKFIERWNAEYEVGYYKTNF